MRLTNLITTDAVAEVLPQTPAKSSVVPVAELAAKPVQDRFVSSTAQAETNLQPVKSTKTAEAHVPTGGTAAATPVK